MYEFLALDLSTLMCILMRLTVCERADSCQLATGAVPGGVEDLHVDPVVGVGQQADHVAAVHLAVVGDGVHVVVVFKVEVNLWVM